MKLLAGLSIVMGTAWLIFVGIVAVHFISKFW